MINRCCVDRMIRKAVTFEGWKPKEGLKRRKPGEPWVQGLSVGRKSLNQKTTYVVGARDSGLLAEMRSEPSALTPRRSEYRPGESGGRPLVVWFRASHCPCLSSHCLLCKIGIIKLCKVASIKRHVSGSASQTTVYSIITNSAEPVESYRHQPPTSKRRWRVRVRRPERGQGMGSGPARNRSASFRLPVPPFSAGTQPCVSCVLTSGACPCPAAEETPRTAANAPAEELRWVRGPRLPAGAASPQFGPRRAAPGLSPSGGGTPHLWDPWKPGIVGRARWGWGAGLARRRPGSHGSGFCRGTERRGSWRARLGGHRSGKRCAAGTPGQGRGRGRGRAVTWQRRKERVTPIPTTLLPSPRRRGPLGRAAVRGRLGPRSGWRAPGVRGVAVTRTPWPGLRPAPRLRLPASPGAAADILRRAGGGERTASAAGKWRPGGARLADGPGLCLPRASLSGPAARRVVPRGGPGHRFSGLLYSCLRSSS